MWLKKCQGLKGALKSLNKKDNMKTKSDKKLFFKAKRKLTEALEVLILVGGEKTAA